MSSANSKRKHVTSACQPCRDSKIRCDGAKPTCGHCSKKDKDCHYATKDDKRRVSLRTAIDILSERVSVLTDTLISHGIPVPPMESQQEATLNDICDTLKIPLPTTQKQNDNALLQDTEVTIPIVPDTNVPLNTDVIPETAFQPPSDIIQTQDLVRPTNDAQDCLSLSNSHPTDGSPADWPWHMFESNAFLLSGPLDFGGFDGDFTQRDFDALVPLTSAWLPAGGQTNNGSSDDEDSDLAHQVSTRFGALRIASDGQLRYYGAATNFHLLEGSRHDEVVDIFTTKQEVMDRLDQAGLSQEIPPDIEEHLIELYFAWHNPHHLTVDRETFFAARANKARSVIEAGYVSDVLINAICAIGAAYETRYHPSFVTYPRSLAEYFGSRATILLEADLESPTIGTVQALCLLSSHEAARGKDARTWLYGGMAMRLCFDLGLHINSTPYVKAGILNQADVRARQTTFWSCAMVNHLSSFHFGRPFRIDSEEITQTPLQAVDNVIDGDQTLGHSQTGPQHTSLKVLKEWTYLCETLSPLMRKLYGSSQTPVTDLQQLSAVVVQQLETWWRSLPADLQIRNGEKAPPEIIFLHMGYHNFQILIHRPWTAHKSQPWTGQGPGFRHARRVCSSSASAISDLLIQYEQEYSFSRMHNYSVNIIFSAALISLFNVIAARSSSNTASTQATANLSIFFRALDDLSRSFDAAKRAREHLATIQRKWYLAGTPPVSGSKRVFNTSYGLHAPKRSKPSNPFGLAE